MAPILTNPGSPLARMMSLIPFSAPILMPLRMSLMTVPWYEMAISLGGVAIACVLSIWLSARIYRVGLLMYGKRPSFRSLRGGFATPVDCRKPRQRQRLSDVCVSLRKG